MNIKIKTLIYTLAFLSILTANIYLPAIPVLQHVFITTKSSMGLTISFYMLGLAIGIPIYGTLSDYIKTSKVLAVGLTLYIVANLIAVFSPNISTFLVARLIQGISAASALCLWQVLAFSYFERQASHIISSGYILIGSMPALAPIFGGIILTFSAWYGVFIFLIIIATVLLLITIQLPDAPTNDHRKDLKKSQQHIVITILQQFKYLFCDLKFMVLALTSASMYISVYVYLSQVPFLLTKLHFTVNEFSLFFVPISVAFILGGIISKKLLKINISFKTIFTLSVSLFVIATTIVLSTKAIGITISGWLLAIPFFIFTIGSGIGVPNIVSKALSLHPHRRGSAASLIGLLQNLAAFIFSGLGAYMTQYGYNGLVISYFLLAGLPLFLFIVFITITKNSPTANNTYQSRL
ncbi:MFS transporter [Francisella adeliensis]|uniref:MFS transporter n=1 Tax=Francisella adeliensis TaxID=2007306 RepID=A0A2Z4Y1N4_9GAMM|nr:MFS transporter [Francisella adeliensis]AXA34603.1 MFS transporter [Francisella adeliensis]MBK2086328.1 MFS transporter [Francisella adeliensis]MBK2096543.1 MFS transporter [Francisella adeliensis]QIW12847.1 multidrug effflux MFS transporter [Francisella adeliensis]QIW14724.1 multidrug effflux MFS transporter [Francisella adeliensis]